MLRIQSPVHYSLIIFEVRPKYIVDGDKAVELDTNKIITIVGP